MNDDLPSQIEQRDRIIDVLVRLVVKGLARESALRYQISRTERKDGLFARLTDAADHPESVGGLRVSQGRVQAARETIRQIIRDRQDPELIALAQEFELPL